MADGTPARCELNKLPLTNSESRKHIRLWNKTQMDFVCLFVLLKVENHHHCFPPSFNQSFNTTQKLSKILSILPEEAMNKSDFSPFPPVVATVTGDGVNPWKKPAGGWGGGCLHWMCALACFILNSFVAVKMCRCSENKLVYKLSQRERTVWCFAAKRLSCLHCKYKIWSDRLLNLQSDSLKNTTTYYTCTWQAL